MKATIVGKKNSSYKTKDGETRYSRALHVLKDEKKIKEDGFIGQEVKEIICNNFDISNVGIGERYNFEFEIANGKDKTMFEKLVEMEPID